MNYYLDLFSPETAKAFTKSNQDISGFRISRKAYIENKSISPGDKFICYCTRIQRFIGVLEVQSPPFIDRKPIFTEDEDPFILRFKVKVQIWLPLDKAILIHNDSIWNQLSFTKNLSKDSNRWTFMVFSSPMLWPKEDCEYIEHVLIKQSKELVTYPFSESDEKKLKPTKIRISSRKEISVSVPDNEEERSIQEKVSKTKEQRDSMDISVILTPKTALLTPL